MTDKITIEELEISGFRAYLESQSFKLRDGQTVKSLAVYAPNAKGKSSLVDAIDFYLSQDGTLERFGLRRAGTNAGPEALEHVKARQKGLQPRVRMSFREGADHFGDSRDLPAQGLSARTEAAARVRKRHRIDFIIRGYQLRRFVEERTSHDRYTDVSNWFALSPLLEIQTNLRALRLRLRRTLDEEAAMKERLRDLRNITAGAIDVWDESTSLAWLNNEYLHKLDATLAISTLDSGSAWYQTLRTRKEQEAEQIGVSALKAAVRTLRQLYGTPAAEDGSPGQPGDLAAMETAWTRLALAQESEKLERAAAEKAVFKEVWEAAETLFEQLPDLDQCPVCAKDMTSAERQSVTPRIKTALAALAAYRNAVSALQSAKLSAQQSRLAVSNQLATCVTTLSAAGREADNPTVVEMVGYRESLSATDPAQPAPDTARLRELLGGLEKQLVEQETQIRRAQGEHTYDKALLKADSLIALKAKIDRLNKKKAEQERLFGALESTESFIAKKLRSQLQSVLDQLRDRMKQLYNSIQPEFGNVPAIRLELDQDAKQPELDLLVDFAANREGRLPSGYLSDSQLHTLALSLRLAALEMANKDVPVIVLDDIVTSYDADHRKAIASMLASELTSMQIIVVTHDELFFRYLQDHLPGKSWMFKRIIGLDENFGPRFHDHRVTAEMIHDKWDSGVSAANELRQAEEEWLLLKAREFGVSVRIREVHGAHKYDRSELAQAIYAFLKESKVDVPNVPGITNPFLLSLQKGDIENFGSHFSDDPNAWGSIGDEKKRWSEFVAFCGYFVCACGHAKFKRPKFGVTKALCGKCETPFSSVRVQSS